MEFDRRATLKEMGTTQESRQGKSDDSDNPVAAKPKPVITGESQAQGIAKFASRMTYEDLTPERRERLKVSVLDSLGCAITALGVPPIAACLEQAKQFGGSDARDRVGS
jgi:MmgE/PrpD N-terminal domain